MSETAISLAGLGMTLQKPLDLKEPEESDDSYTLTELESSHPQFKEVAVDFKNAGLKVVKLEHLDNLLLWQKYTAEKRTIEHRNRQDPKFQLNEKYLYHGTTGKKEYICTEGLDARLSKKGRFGQGIYFGDNPLKCTKYSRKKEHTNFIVLARVILGCCKVYPRGKSDRSLTREPVKDPPHKGWRFYDSLEGCPKDYKEFVIYRNDKALIECIITYAVDRASTSSSSLSVPRATSLSAAKVFLPAKPASELGDRHAAKSPYRNNDSDSDSTSESDEKAESTDSNDDDDKSGSSDSDHNERVADVDGSSSDSSLDEASNDNNQRSRAQRLFDIRSVCTPAPTSRIQTGEYILADKKKEFTRKTGETRQPVIESYLSTTGLDVDKAVRLFVDKETKKKEMERKQNEMKQKPESSDEEDTKYEDAVGAHPVNPANDPDKWNRMTTGDKEAIVEALTDTFLTVIGLPDNTPNRALSRKVLFSCDCDIDRAIVTYYESL